MSNVLSFDCEAGTGTVTGANSPFTDFTGTAAFSTSQFAHGAKSLSFDTAAVNTVGEILGTGVTKRGIRRYIRMPSLPGAGQFVNLLRIRDAGNITTAEVRVNSSGQLVLRNGTTTTIATSTATITANTWFRLEWLIDGTVQALKYFASMDSFTATETIGGGASSYSGTAFTRIVSGHGTAVSGMTGTLYIDDFADDDTTYPGPVGAAPSSTGLYTYRAADGVWK